MKSRREIEEELGVTSEEGGVYSSGDREQLMDDGQIDEVEEGFMQGYEEGERVAKCAFCKEILADEFVEEEIEDRCYRFCSYDHAELFVKKLEKER